MIDLRIGVGLFDGILHFDHSNLLLVGFKTFQ
jgi:hypothetical protein